MSASVPNATAIPRPAIGGRAGVPALEFLRHPVSAVGVAIVALIVLVAIAAPLLAPFDPIAQPARRLLPPDSRYLLGTDEFGRDVLSRIIYGSRVSLQVGIISVGIALLLGGTVGLASGYFLGVLDILVQRVVDVMLGFPTVILIITIASVLGPSLTTAMIAIGLTYSPSFARIARGPTLAVRAQPYVESARAVGVSPRRILARYILPNIAAPLIVQATLAFSTAVLAEASLSFLGLGTQPPNPSWGAMLGSGREYMELAPWVAIFPGLAIAITVLGLNLLGDALRDLLDPRLRGL